MFLKSLLFMDKENLYTPSTFRIITSIIGLGFIVILLFSYGSFNFRDFSTNTLIPIFTFLVGCVVILVATSMFNVPNMPYELNNLVLRTGIGILTAYVLAIIFIPLSFIFGIFYTLYLISKIDENNTMLYNEIQRLVDINLKT